MKNPRRVAIALFAMILTALFIFIQAPMNGITGASLSELTEWTDEAGTYPLPHEYPMVLGKSYQMSAVLPDALTGRECLIFRTENLAVEVKVGGQTLYQTDDVPEHHTIGDEWHFICLPADAEGQTVTINSTIRFLEASKLISSVYIGLQTEFLQRTLRRQLPEFMISVLLFLVGAVLLASKILITRRLMAQSTVSFALFCMVLGVWTAIQTGVVELLYGQSILLLHLTYGALPFATALICFFLRVLPGPKWLNKTYF